MWTDLRYAARRLRRDWVFTAMAVTALSLGIAANTTVFTFINAVLFAGLPFDEPDRIVHLGTRSLRENRLGAASLADFVDWRGARSFAGLGAARNARVLLDDPNAPAELRLSSRVTANTFSVLRQPVLIGRDLLEADAAPAADPVAILGYDVWQRRYAGDEAVLGRTVTIQGRPTTVIGVMPPNMKFPVETSLWLPLASTETSSARDNRNTFVFGRLRDGVSRAAAAAEMAALAARLARAYPETNTDVGVVVQSFNEWVDSGNQGRVRFGFMTLLVAVAFVLLIACANVASLLLARAAGRTREVAVRLSLGARRWHIVRQLVAEHALLGSLSAVVALAVTPAGVSAFASAIEAVGQPYWVRFDIDARVYGFLAAVSLMATLVFGLAPALHGTRRTLVEVLKQSAHSVTASRHARRTGMTIVAAEIALATILLSGAGIAITSFLNLYRVNLGFDTGPLLTMRLVLPEPAYAEEDRRVAFTEQLVRRLATVPGVESAAVTSAWPGGGGSVERVEIAGQTVERSTSDTVSRVSVVTVGPGYFETLRLPLLRGRGLRPGDPVGRTDAIVNTSFVDRFLSNGDPIGRQLRLPDAAGTPGPWLTVVGVSPTIPKRGLRLPEPDAVVYRPYATRAPAVVPVVLRGAGDPTDLGPAVRLAVASLDPSLPVFALRPMTAVLAQSRWPYTLFGSLMGVFAAVALFLSALGIYGVTTFDVSQRTREIGVRLALGAQRRDVRFAMMRSTLSGLLLGLMVGLAGSVALANVLRSVLVQTTSTASMPATLTVSLATLAVVALTAVLIPAVRAARRDPIMALRTD
jgi:putative ABC transport system permease protein